MISKYLYSVSCLASNFQKLALIFVNNNCVVKTNINLAYLIIPR